MKSCKIILLIVAMLLPATADAVRIKDIVTIKGVRKNQLFGYGLVLGLAGTGDSGSSVPFITQSVAAMISRMGITMTPSEISALKVKNIAAVIVTANLPPFARQGNKIDISISSIGDATSLKGGNLLFTPLKAANGEIYAIAQGAVSIGGGSNKKGEIKSHLTVGKIANGAIIEKEIPFNFQNKKYLTLTLHKSDFTTAFRITEAINSKLKDTVAQSLDAGTIQVKIPVRFKKQTIAFISYIESISVTPDMIAKVVIDERTGTVVVGKNVVITTVAISHGNLSVQVKPSVSEVSAPAATIRRRRRPASRRGGAAKGNRLMLLEDATNIDNLVHALNAIGVSSQDLITIFQALKASGALQAELEII